MLEETLVEKKTREPENGEGFDVVVIGAGPGGMSAALCAARAKLNVLVLEKALPGGQASTAYRIFNFLGYPDGIMGVELAKRMEDHLNQYEIAYSCENVSDIVNIHGPEKKVHTDLGNIYSAKTIIIATGLEPKRLDMPFESKFYGRGISYFAQGDAEDYAGKDVAVIGGGNCACYATEFLSEHVNQLYIIHSGDQLKAVKYVKEKIEKNPKITTIWNSKVVDVFGIDKVEKIKLENLVTGQYTWLDVKGVFLYVGRRPPRDLVNLNVHVDESGYVVTDEYMRTNIKGVYAVGDIRAKQIRQIATAVSDGMIAAVNIERDFFR